MADFESAISCLDPFIRTNPGTYRDSLSAIVAHVRFPNCDHGTGVMGYFVVKISLKDIETEEVFFFRACGF